MQINDIWTDWPNRRPPHAETRFVNWWVRLCLQLGVVILIVALGCLADSIFQIVWVNELMLWIQRVLQGR